jgi:hypothetical protein
MYVRKIFEGCTTAVIVKFVPIYAMKEYVATGGIARHQMEVRGQHPHHTALSPRKARWITFG